jgi:hypothetical protein
MKRVLLTLLLTISIVTFVSAQDYKTGVGLRGGLGYGITLKHFLGEKAAVEGLLSTRWGGFEITGLYEIHNPAFEVEHLNWYYGGGAHIGFWNGNSSWGTTGTSYTVIGVDGIIGIEYSFSEVPLNIGADWKPAINLSGYKGFWGDTFALSIRYIF